VVASQNLRKPSVPIHRDALRYHGDETNLTEGASLGAESVRAEPQPGHRPVLRLSACSAGPRSPPRSLKAELRRAEPNKNALRVTSKEGTADFADFADERDAAQGSRRRAQSLVRDIAMPAAILSGSFLSCHPRSVPPPRGRRRLVAAAPPPNLELPGTRRPSPYPQHQLLRGRRRPVSTPPTPSKPTPSGTRRPSPHPDSQLLRGRRRLVSTPPTCSQRPSSVRHFPCASPTRLQNPERVSDSSRG